MNYNYIPKIQELLERPLKDLTCMTDDVELQGEFLEIPMRVNRTREVIEAVVCPTKKSDIQLVISTQQGCNVRCWFCDMGDLNSNIQGNNLTPNEMLEELTIALQQGMSQGYDFDLDSLKITFAKGGEPLMNPNLLEILEIIKVRLGVKIKISTTFPACNLSRHIFDGLLDFAEDYPNTIQPQISLLSTDENRRREITSINPISFSELRKKAEGWHCRVKNARKFLLSFTLDVNTPCVPEAINTILPPEYFAVRLRRWIPTINGKQYGLKRPILSKIRDLENRFRDYGYMIIPGESTATEVENGLTAGYNHRRMPDSDY